MVVVDNSAGIALIGLGEPGDLPHGTVGQCHAMGPVTRLGTGFGSVRAYFFQLSRRVTVRLKIGAPSRESTRSATK